MCPQLCLGAVRGYSQVSFLRGEHTEYGSVSFFAVFMAPTNSSPTTGSNNRSGYCSNIASMEEQCLESMFVYFQLPLIQRNSQKTKGSAAPQATEKSIPDRCSGSAGLNRWFRRAYSGQCNQSSCSCKPLRVTLTNLEKGGQHWEESTQHLLPRTEINFS